MGQWVKAQLQALWEVFENNLRRTQLFIYLFIHHISYSNMGHNKLVCKLLCKHKISYEAGNIHTILISKQLNIFFLFLYFPQFYF